MSKSVGKGQKLERDKEGGSLRVYRKKKRMALPIPGFWKHETIHLFSKPLHLWYLIMATRRKYNWYHYYVAKRLLEDKKDFMPFRHPLWVSGTL